MGNGEAVEDHLRKDIRDPSKDSLAPAWMSAFGGLRGLQKETERIGRLVEREFEQIDEEEWR